MWMLAEDKLGDAVLRLLFTNKQDLPNAKNSTEITDKLGLHYCATGTGTFRSPVSPVGKGSIRDWTGCPTSSGTQSELRSSLPPHSLLRPLFPLM